MTSPTMVNIALCNGFTPFIKMRLKMSSAKWWLLCSCPSILIHERHRENIPSAKLPPPRVIIKGIHPGSNFPDNPTLARVLLAVALSVPSTHCSPQLLMSPLIKNNKGNHPHFLRLKNLINHVNYARMNLFHKKGCWFKIRTKFNDQYWLR